MFKAVTRGRLRQVVLSSTLEPVLVKLFGCEVIRGPYEKHGKRYVVVRQGGIGDTDLLARVDEFIRHQAHPDFSPVGSDGLLTLKIPNTASFEDADGAPVGRTAGAACLDIGSLVDVVLSPGAFGSFGWCLLLHRAKPSFFTSGQR